MIRRYMIGDIRGELSLLEKLMDKIGPVQGDFILFLGSYLGPGPDSKGVIDYILELKKKFPENIACLGGCYEYMFNTCVQTNPDWSAMELWGRMGGGNVFRSYAAKESLMVMKVGNNGKPTPMKAGIAMAIPEPHIVFMEKDLHQWFQDDTFPYIGSHAGGHPGLCGGELQTPDQVYFSQADWWLDEKKFIPGKTVVFSHNPFKVPFRGKGKLGIDLGAGFGGKLGAFEMMGESITIVGRKNG